TSEVVYRLTLPEAMRACDIVNHWLAFRRCIAARSGRSTMKHALYAPNFGTFGDIDQLIAFARDAEDAGWDGFFLWDHLQTIDLPPDGPVLDPWIAMAGIACATDRMRLGALVTPLSRRRPWKVARETVTLDHLSHGRLVVGAGIG